MSFNCENKKPRKINFVPHVRGKWLKFLSMNKY